jgi:hypothetical protein
VEKNALGFVRIIIYFMIYNPNDVLITQRNSTSSSFVEQVLSSSANSVVLFDSTAHLISLSTQSFLANSLKSLTSHYIPKWETSSLVNSRITDDGTDLTITVGDGSGSGVIRLNNNGGNGIYLDNDSLISIGGDAAVNINSTNIVSVFAGSASFSSPNNIALGSPIINMYGAVVVQENFDQSSDALQIQDNNSNVLSRIDINGNISCSNAYTTASYAVSASVLSPSFINVPNGVAGLDSNDNLSGVVIPLQDTQQNLGGIVPASGQFVYAIDTKASFIGDGTSSIAPTFVSQSITNLAPLTRFSPLSGSGVDGLGKVGIASSFSYSWPVMFQNGVGSFVLYQLPNDATIKTMLAKITTFVWEGEDAYDELHIDTIGAYWAGTWIYSSSSRHISSSAANNTYNYTASFNTLTRQLLINYNNATSWASPAIIKLEVDISNNTSP